MDQKKKQGSSVGDAIERLDKAERKWVNELDKKGQATPATLDEMRKAENNLKKKLR